MEQQGQETPEEKSRREELFRVIEKSRNTPIQNNTKEQVTSKKTTTENMTTAKKPHPPFHMTQMTYRQLTSKSIWEPLESDTSKWDGLAISKKTRSGIWRIGRDGLNQNLQQI